MKPLEGLQFVSYHEHWPYFADALAWGMLAPWS